MKLFITGGAGFIGSNFIRHWLNKYPKDEIIVFDNLTYAASLDRLPKDDQRLTFIKGDVCDYKATKKAMQGSDLVVHFAAETHVDRSLSGLEAEKLFFRTNVEGTMSVLHAAKENKVKRFHHISTDEVYGDLELDAKEIFHENFPYNPHNPYAISKAAADFAVKAFSRTCDLPVTISNCTNNYGPYQTPEKMIPRSILLLSKGEKIQLYTDQDGNPGKNVRDWLHTQDHCEAIEKIITDGKIGETYCIGGENELTNLDLVHAMLKEASKVMGENFTFDTHVELVKDRPGHDLRYAMDISKIKKELNWKPKISFKEGMKQTVGWYLSKEGQAWLKTLEESSQELRKDQSKKI